MKIVPKDFPLNAGMYYTGRGIELLTLRDKLDSMLLGGSYLEWGYIFGNRRRYKKLKKLRKKVQSHLKWYFNTKFPTMPEMHAQKFRGGYVFFLVSDYTRFNKSKTTNK